MNFADVVILLLLALSAILGFRSGLIQAFFSLGGLIAGIAIASRYYRQFGDDRWPLLHNRPLSEAIWFCVISLVVMIVAGLIGMLLKGLIHGVGLGWLDKLLGLIFGLLRGALLVALGILTLIAFFPDSLWLNDTQLTRYFVGTTRLTLNLTAEDLKNRIEYGLHLIENGSKELLHSK